MRGPLFFSSGFEFCVGARLVGQGFTGCGNSGSRVKYGEPVLPGLLIALREMSLRRPYGTPLQGGGISFPHAEARG